VKKTVLFGPKKRYETSRGKTAREIFIEQIGRALEEVTLKKRPIPGIPNAQQDQPKIEKQCPAYSLPNRISS
jgi:hypothetical protein